jgi:hypothetical protein
MRVLDADGVGRSLVRPVEQRPQSLWSTGSVTGHRHVHDRVSRSRCAIAELRTRRSALVTIGEVQLEGVASLPDMLGSSGATCSVHAAADGQG